MEEDVVRRGEEWIGLAGVGKKKRVQGERRT
jgi:hypothetical protein